MDYIHINSVEDIQPEKISIRNLNRKYIDRYGNRYATKFNLKTKKVEIVRLASSRDEALRMRDEIRQTRIKKEPGSFGILPGEKINQNIPDYFKSDDSFETPSNFFAQPPRNEKSSETYNIIEDQDYDPYAMDVDRETANPFTKRNLSGIAFYEKPFIDRCLQEIQKTKERHNAVISYIKKTKLFEKDDKDLFDALEREIDIECWQRGEKMVNYHRELYSYPRPLNYYTTRVPTEKKKVLEGKKEEEKLDLVRRWELQESFEKTFKHFHDTTEKVFMLLQEKISGESFNSLPAQTRQLIKDAQTSCQIILESSVEITQQIGIWRNKYP